MAKTKEILGVIWLLISIAQIHISTFSDEVYLTPDSLLAIIDKYYENKQPLFIAFYDEEDFQGSNRSFLTNVHQACLANNEFNIQFFVYGSPIPESIRDKFFLHYYTLPKLKFFGPDGVETYYGGPSLKAVDAWIKRKFRDEI